MMHGKLFIYRSPLLLGEPFLLSRRCWYERILVPSIPRCNSGVHRVGRLTRPPWGFLPDLLSLSLSFTSSVTLRPNDIIIFANLPRRAPHERNDTPLAYVLLFPLGCSENVGEGLVGGTGTRPPK
ncbi:hypothetical protein ARMSODRAFT_607785 [Armillaria solidipes]|uniref:Uncharacterized protein n=1 Tax=Armillaria solidipes TaxID=1076256 RepID=A0A2H3AZW4_9AGAR|nr:hypothetical protein ARMSODRAFT_607785 [Armillaria solidipes]